MVPGVSTGFTMSPVTNSIINSLPPDRAGIGSAMNDITRWLGGTLGVAILGLLMNGRYCAGVGTLMSINGAQSSFFVGHHHGAGSDRCLAHAAKPRE